jgi:Tfp pilus assembly ATPase PilU
MITLDDHLKQLYTQGIISYESALEVAVDPKELGIQLSKIQPATVKKKK